MHARRSFANVDLIAIVALIAPIATARAESPVAEIPFTVPPGFVVEKVAGPPLVEHPMFACFDDCGRLYVADSGGKNLKADDLLKELPSCIRLLEDTKGNGVFDKSHIFADKMSFPMGVLWHQGAVYCCSPPSLWRLTDTRGAGVADERRELVTKFNSVGNAADIHGPWLGPDGWLYWTDGRNGHEVKVPGSTTVLKGKAACIFRCKLDGSSVEIVCGGGMDDPVQMAFTEEGEPFAVVDIFQARPTRMDALIYCIDGGVFPYHEGVLGEFKRTGPLLPAVSELGWVAPSGLIRYRSSAFGPQFTDTLLSTQFNTHKIIRHALQRAGAGFTSKDEEFITSTDPDFHPTSLVEDADGSLLIIDTGGWFRIGCPTSQVAKPDIKGGIYRVRRVGAPKTDDSRGLNIEWKKLPPEKLVPLLDDPRWTVRDRAVEETARRGSDVFGPVGDLLSRGTTRARVNAIWALSRCDLSRARNMTLALLTHPDAIVRQCAARSVGLHQDSGSRGHLESLGDDPSLAVRREAAIALGRIRESDSAYSLIDRFESLDDQFLDHAIVHALIEIHSTNGFYSVLRYKPGHWNSGRLRRAMIALDQIEDGWLKKETVLPLLSNPDQKLRETAWRIALKHSEWATDLESAIGKLLRNPQPSSAETEQLMEALIRSARALPVQSLISKCVLDQTASDDNRAMLLEVMAAADVGKVPATWISALKTLLKGYEPKIVRGAIRTIRERDIRECDDELKALVVRGTATRDVALEAFAVLVSRWNDVPAKLIDAALACWKDDSSVTLRRTAAEALAKAKLDEPQLLAVARLLPRCSPLELPRLLDAFRLSASAPVGREVIRQLEVASALGSLSPKTLHEVIAGFPSEVQASAEPLFKKLTIDESAQRKKLAEFAAGFKDADAKRGRDVFFSRKAVCSACHAVRGEGERIGPDLSKIGSIRTETDLLESVLFPSNSVARGFESYTINTITGNSYSGLIRRETSDAVYLVPTDRNEIRIPRSKIESMAVSPTSIMPQGLENTMTRQELGDLIAFLKSLR